MYLSHSCSHYDSLNAFIPSAHTIVHGNYNFNCNYLTATKDTRNLFLGTLAIYESYVPHSSQITYLDS